MDYYPVGTKFKTRGKHPKECTVIDYYTVTNLNGDVVDNYYVAEYEFMGQTIVDRNVPVCTIAMGLIK